MKIYKMLKEYESSFRDFWNSMDEFYKTIVMLPNSSDRDKLLKKYRKLEQSRERHYDSVENLINEIDNHTRIK